MYDKAKRDRAREKNKLLQQQVRDQLSGKYYPPVANKPKGKK